MQSIDWAKIGLVVFDLDGTLYDQKRLRLIMATALLFDLLKSRSFNTIRVLREYRKSREILAEHSPSDFIDRQFEMPAQRCRCSAQEIKALVNEWIEVRPLRHLAACRYSGIAELFSALRRSGRIVAVLSDYAVSEKLAALGLKADIMVSADDPQVQSLKPDPKGLQWILDSTGIDVKHALMVGDRFDRDWEVARRVGMDAIVRTSQRDTRCITFKTFHDAIFDPVRRVSETGYSLQSKFESQDRNASKF